MMGKNAYKPKELLLISNLRKNSRATLTELSKWTGIPISTVHDKLKTQDIIKKNTCILDFSKLGFTTVAKILLKVKKEEKEGLLNYLLAHFNVNSIYKINSGFDLMVECVFKNIKQLEDFTDELEETFKIKGKQVFYIIDEIAKEKFMENPEQIGMVLDA